MSSVITPVVAWEWFELFDSLVVLYGTVYCTTSGRRNRIQVISSVTVALERRK